MRPKYFIFTVLFILIGSGSLFFGFTSCQSVNDEKTQTVKDNTESKKSNDTNDKKDNKDKKNKTTTAVASPSKGQAASFSISEVGFEKNVQESLNKKSHQILDVWMVVKTMDGVINVLQSAQVKSKYFLEASANPMEFLAPIDSILDKLSGMLLGAYCVIAFQKMLLSLPIFFALILMIPILVLIAIILLWTYKNRTEIYKIAIASVLFTLIIPCAILLSINTPSLLGNKILVKNVNTLVVTITEENGKAVSAMEDDILRSKKTGNSIIKYMDEAKTLSETIIDNVIDYYIIFLFIFIVIPILTLLLILLLSIYGVKLILGKKE